MRRKASFGFVLLGLGACTHLPGIVRIDVDGSTLEFKKDPNAQAPQAPQAEPPAPEAEPPAPDDQPR